MGYKTFVSYKYHDSKVANLKIFPPSTVRDYVDIIEKTMGEDIYKGESDDEDSDLSGLSEETIAAKLKAKIGDSTVTVVLISPGMREALQEDGDQWIPWEVGYSLRDLDGKPTSGLVFVVLPDVHGSFSYFEQRNASWWSDNYKSSMNRLFKILEANLNNHHGYTSYSLNNYGSTNNYAVLVKWPDFQRNMHFYIDEAYSRRDECENYNIAKTNN